MDKNTLSAFFDELSKIASVPAEAANKVYGLPIKSRKGKAQDWGSEADSGFRQSAAIFGDQAPNYTMGDITTAPAQNPGGV